MAHKTSCFLAVKVEDLLKTPPAFQSYVEKYFEQVDILGVPAYAVVTTTGGIKNYGGKPQKGVAPSHSVELMEFSDKEGYPKGVTGLCDWIHRESQKKRGGLIFQFYQSWNDGCLESDDD